MKKNFVKLCKDTTYWFD